MAGRSLLFVLFLLCTGGLLLLVVVLFWLLWRKPKPEAETLPSTKSTPVIRPAVEPTPAPAPTAGATAVDAEKPFTVWREPISAPEPAAVEPFTVWKEPATPPAPASASVTRKAPARKAMPRAKADDLKVVEGIGPKVSAALNEAGIRTFAQLADAPVARLREILDAAGWRYMDPATWPQQAALADRDDWDGLKALQDTLKGGRKA